MSYFPENALIIQSDRSVLLEVHSPHADAAREAIAPFAELVKSPEHIHTYQISPLSIWNARAAGMPIAEMIAALEAHSKYPMPVAISQELETLGNRYGLTTIDREGEILLLTMADLPLAELLSRDRDVGPFLAQRRGDLIFEVDPAHRGVLKQALLGAGYPAEDLAGYIDGDKLAVELRSICQSGQPFALRHYQIEAVAAFYQAGLARGGSGTIVLPCGAGKTMVGLAAIAAIGENTLVLTSSLTSVRQWRRELLDKTNLPPESIAEYSGQSKETAPITLATYQILSYRAHKTDEFPHFKLFDAKAWGLIIYDEVHLLPAPMFRITAQLQARRRLGLTATLIREDGKEGDVFALIGPKRYDVPWRELEGQGFIAPAECTEIRVAQDAHEQMQYALAAKRNQFRIAAENPRKYDVVLSLLEQQKGHRILIIGEYLDQLNHLAKITGLPLVTGKTAQLERDQLYQEFRMGSISGLVLSRVGNFALDLPDADVLIQVSGKYGSRQEEAQRLGRVLRPKSDGRSAQFYTLVSQRTCEEDLARHRQLFLSEQGYFYRIESHD
jgi:DNA excision repair protein ERCC-3